MGRASRFRETAATPEEDSYGYRVEWDNHLSWDLSESEGPGSRSVSGFDNAWDVFNDCRDDFRYRGARLIRIDSDGNETVYARK